jgi:hypothetical protein
LKLQTAIGEGGGDIGKKINHGSGDGGDDDGDDDDYFDDFDDGDKGDEGGLFRRRKFIEELHFYILNPFYAYQKNLLRRLNSHTYSNTLSHAPIILNNLII